MLKGIAASAGVSVAKVYKLETPKVVIEKKAGVAEEEVKKFEDALEKTKKDIEGVKERAAKRLSEEELAVFDAHLMMAGDPELAGQIKAMIENDGVNAEYATEQAYIWGMSLRIVLSQVILFIWLQILTIKEKWM